MASNEPPKKPPRRPPPTIDLSATEVRVEASHAENAAEPTHAEPDVTASSESPHAAERAATPPPPPHSPWSLLSAGAGGAAVLLVGLLLWAVGVIAPRDQPSAQLAARLAALEAQSARQPALDPKAVDEIAARVAKVEAAASAPRAAEPDATVTSRLGSIEVAVKSLGDTAATLTSRSEEVSAALRAVRERADATAKTLADLQALVERQQASPADKVEIERLAGRLAALESSTRTVEQKIETPGSTAADRDVRMAVLATALKDAVERGSPYATELSAIKPLVTDQKVVAALEPLASTGAPTPATLSVELAALVPTLMQSATAQPRNGGLLDRLQANASRLVRIRPADDPGGDDPAIVAERIAARAQRQDVTGAISELAKLAPAQRAPAEAWIAKAQARNAAVAAAQTIAADTYGALARPAH